VGIAIQQSELYQQLQRELDDRQEAEQKIREQAALLDISTDAILVCNLDFRILYWNQGAEHLYGWQAEEALGQKANELLLRSPSAFVAMKQTVLEQGTWHGEIQRFTKTGKEVTVEGRCTLVRDEAGQPKSILSVDTDITEKKSLEAQFYQAQRLESLGTLTSGIAHDLNNTLTPILTIAQLLRMTQSELDAQSREMLQVLEESAQRGANMVKQILTFTRGTGGKRSPVDVASLLQEVVKVAQQTFPKPITIRAIVPPEGIWQVSADATQLHQVLMNLCVNARDAMPAGGTLTLSVETFDANEIFAQINMDAHVGQYVLITVTDTGTGIAPEVRDRIFDPFFTTKAIGQGTGLGLSTVLGIVRSYGGFIQVASEVGKGTQFKIYLPAVETGAASSLQETALPQGQGELILVVDD
ncbi:MAG TPA: ATP-binding protein, partial [Allocoleopsis sp.]